VAEAPAFWRCTHHIFWNSSVGCTRDQICSKILQGKIEPSKALLIDPTSPKSTRHCFGNGLEESSAANTVCMLIVEPRVRCRWVAERVFYKNRTTEISMVPGPSKPKNEMEFRALTTMNL